MTRSTDRRTFIAASAALAVLPAVARAAPETIKMFVGTYNDKTHKGLYPLTYDAARDAWALGDVVPQAENVSFGAYSPKHRLHYLLNEQDDGKVAAFSAKGWTSHGDLSTHGASPAYISLNAEQSMIAMANYSTGDVVFYALDAKGLPHEPAIIRQNSGKGPNTDRQQGPHAHWVQFASDHIYSVDLGTDQVLKYSYDAKTQAVGEHEVAFQAPPGIGPRHLAFHPNGRNAYLVTELGNTVIALRREGGDLKEIQTLSTLPADFTAHSQAAHLVLNKAGTRLYASNRGHNSIAVFAINDDGTLKLLQIQPTLGDWPRFFLLMEAQKRLVVAHQNGGTLVVFKVAEDGTLAPAGQSLTVPSPVYIGNV